MFIYCQNTSYLLIIYKIFQQDSQFSNKTYVHKEGNNRKLKLHRCKIINFKCNIIPLTIQGLEISIAQSSKTVQHGRLDNTLNIQIWALVKLNISSFKIMELS